MWQSTVHGATILVVYSVERWSAQMMANAMAMPIIDRQIIDSISLLIIDSNQRIFKLVGQ